MNDPIHIISLGAGVQSSTMALMASAGDITPMPTAAIFADTGDEPMSVYQWLMWLEKHLPFPVYRVSKGVLSKAATTVHVSKTTGNGYLKPGLPVFFREDKFGMGVRQCTQDHKIEPIRKKLRELRNGSKVVQWIGISLDEISRMKPSRDSWCENIWPLVDKRMNRNDCIQWMQRCGYPKPPRSACVYCPYHSDSEWTRLKNDEPIEFDRAVDFEQQLQMAASKASSMRSVPFLHRSCKPLSEVDFSTEEERGQLNMFNNECEGLCGV